MWPILRKLLGTPPIVVQTQAAPEPTLSPEHERQEAEDRLKALDARVQLWQHRESR